MHIKFNSIQARLFTGFLLLTMITIALLFVVFYFYDKIEESNSNEKKVENLMMESLFLMATDEEFLTDGIHNESFFKDETSPYLQYRDSTISEITKQIIKLNKAEEDSTITISYLEMIDILKSYDSTYNLVLELYRKRGYKDYGIEGEMRHWIHVLEDSSTLNFKDEWILRLRRFEKDYIIRKDTLYIKQHDDYSKYLMNTLRGQEKYSAGLEILKFYCAKFEELVEIENILGFESNTGLKNELYKQKLETAKLFRVLAKEVSAKSDELTDQAIFTVEGTTAFAIIFSFAMSIFMARRFSKPIKNLSDNIDDFLYKDWKADLQLDENIDILELKNLTKSYKKLVKQLKDQFEETKTKSEELDLQNGRLLQLGEEMDHFVRSSSSKLRSPLNSLQGLIELIKLGKLQANDSQTVSMMEQSLSQIENYLQEINQYVELKKGELESESIDIYEVINSIIQEKRVKNSVPLNLKLEIDRATKIKSDPKRFSQIISHVVNNAFQYHDREINKLNLLVISRIENDILYLEIQDDGIGIDEEHHEDVFNMFFRATQISKGPGLGLYIARASLKTIGGEIRLKSKIGEGTMVFIQIPVDADSLQN